MIQHQKNIYYRYFLTGAKRREFLGSNNHPSNPQQPINSLRLAPVSYIIKIS
jgi:hypothetical protein